MEIRLGSVRKNCCNTRIKEVISSANGMARNPKYLRLTQDTIQSYRQADRVTDRQIYRHDLLNIYLSTYVKALTAAPETSSDFGHGIWTTEMCQPVFIEADHVLALSETQSLFSYKHF